MGNRGGDTKRKPKRTGRLDPGKIEASPSDRPEKDREPDAALTFEAELTTYRKCLQELLASKREFVLIRGEDVDGTFETYEDALEAGYTRYGLEPFLVKQIRPAEPIQYFTRDLR